MSLNAYELLRPLRPALIPVPAAQHKVCYCCHGSAGAGYEHCMQCNDARRLLGTLPDVLPITMSVHLSQTHLVLRDYKDGRADVRERFTLQLAALTAIFLQHHSDCLGSWDYVTTIPSSRRNAPASVLARIAKGVRGEHRDVLTAMSGALGRRVRADRFSASRIKGDRILVFEDTFVSGAATFSAALSLRRAGAVVVGPLVMGRHIRSDWSPSAELLGWLRDIPWSEDACVRCGGARREPASLF